MNKKQQNKSSWVAALLMATAVNARIVDDPFWNSHNKTWSETKVVNGIVEGTTDQITQMITSPQSTVGHPDDYMTAENVERVKAIFPRSTFNDWTDATADANYYRQYDNFLRAVAKFPAFCNESKGISLGESCKREIATLFAHMLTASDGLSQVSNGPMGLTADADKKGCSRAFYEGFDRSNELQSEPDRLATDAYVGFASAIWKYMTPQSPSPSMHNVMTGYYEPNAGDLAAGHKAGFGSTTIIASPSSCSYIVTADDKNRGDLYVDLISDLGGVPDTQNINCVNMWAAFAWNGSSNKILFFARDWSSSMCKAVTWPTAYSAFERDGYKKCVCKEFNLLNQAQCHSVDTADPEQSEPSPEPQPDEDPVDDDPVDDPVDDDPVDDDPVDEDPIDDDPVDDDPVDDDPVDDDPVDDDPVDDDPVDDDPVDDDPVDEDPAPTPDDDPEPEKDPLQQLIDMISEIRNKPHYSDDEQSRTTWQVDETLDYVEEQLWLIEQAFKQAGLMQ